MHRKDWDVEEQRCEVKSSDGREVPEDWRAAQRFGTRNAARLYIPNCRACLSPHAKLNRDDDLVAQTPNRLADAYFNVSYAVMVAGNRPGSRHDQQRPEANLMSSGSAART
jgi:hypothetical protein